MSSEASELCPDSNTLVEEVIEYFQNAVSREELHFLLTDHEAWEIFVTEATLSREEADPLREALKKLERAMNREARDKLAKEKFLNMFPGLKLMLEERIRKLHEFADEIDSVHNIGTIYSILGDPIDIMSDLTTLLHLGVPSLTGEASLTLSGTEVGLGAASAVTHVSTNIVEDSSESSTIAEASRLTSNDTDEEEVTEKVLCCSPSPPSSSADRFLKRVIELANNVRAIKVARANPHLVVNAQGILRGETVSVQSARQGRNAFRGTPLSVARGAGILGTGTAGFVFAMDVLNLVKDSGHLQEGAKTESAEELRQEARELESRLEALTKIYESVMEGPTP